MARRNLLLDSLKRLENGAETPPPPAPPPVTSSYRGAVGALEGTLRALESRAIREIDPAAIRASRFADRLDVEEGLDELVDSIRESGQQQVVVLRALPPQPDAGPVYEVVTGRRRIAACRRLGIMVRAVVADLDDEQAVIAQGLENAARLENSFIERALFIHDVLAAGHKAVTAEKALGIDSTLLSRMRVIAAAIPRDLVRAIGSAPGVGRRPWDELARAFKTDAPPDLERLLALIDRSIPSAERLHTVLAALKSPAPPRRVKAERYRRLAEGRLAVKRTPKSLAVRLGSGVSPAFLDYLVEHLEELHAGFLSRQNSDK